MHRLGIRTILLASAVGARHHRHRARRRPRHHRHRDHHRPVRADVRPARRVRPRCAAGREDVVRGGQQEGRHPRPQDQGPGRGRQVQSRTKSSRSSRSSSPSTRPSSCTAARARAAAVAAQEFVTREKVPHVMLNASGDGAVIPPTRYVFGAFAGTQRTVGATLAEFAVKELKGQARRHHRARRRLRHREQRDVQGGRDRARRAGGRSRTDFAAHHRRDGADAQHPRRQSGRDHLHRLSGARRC